MWIAKIKKMIKIAYQLGVHYETFIRIILLCKKMINLNVLYSELNNKNKHLKLIYSLIFIVFISLLSCTKKKVEIKKVKEKSTQKEIVKEKKIIKVAKPNAIALNSKNAVNFFKDYGNKNKENKVVFKTRLGNIIIKLYNNTPLHRASFIFLTKNGYFDTTCFHRVVPGFIAQGGDSENLSTSQLRNKYKHYLLPSEFRKNRKHKRGVIAAARDWDDNPEKKSTPFEFYFTVNRRGEHHLNGEHTVFGEVIKGMQIIDKITKLRTGKDEWPYQDVYIDAEVVE